jgi:hypothetical protein
METQNNNKNMETQNNNTAELQTVVVEEYESPGRFKQLKKEEPTLKFSFGDLLKNKIKSR